MHFWDHLYVAEVCETLSTQVENSWSRQRMKIQDAEVFQITLSEVSIDLSGAIVGWGRRRLQIVHEVDDFTGGECVKYSIKLK